MLKQFTEEEALSLLSEGRLGHLGCVTQEGPYVVPINYIFHDGNIYIHSFWGAKIEALRQNPKVCLQVDKLEHEYKWSSAIAFGQYEEITNPDDRYWFIRLILVRFPHLTPVASISSEVAHYNIVIFRFY